MSCLALGKVLSSARGKSENQSESPIANKFWNGKINSVKLYKGI